MRRAIAVLLGSFLAGCTAPYTLPPLPPSHPASAEAAEAPPPPVSRSLAQPSAPPAASDSEAEAMGDPHMGHEMSEPRHGGHR